MDDKGVRWSAHSSAENGGIEDVKKKARKDAEGYVSTSEAGAATQEKAIELKEKVRVYLESFGITREETEKLVRVPVYESARMAKEFQGGASWDPRTGTIQTDFSDNGDEHALAHEIGHAAALNKVIGTKSGDVMFRSGFITTVNGHEFEELGEMVNDKIAEEALGRVNQERVERKEQILEAMIWQVAGAEKKSGGILDHPTKVWAEFVRSHVRGWSPDLKRALVRTYGKDVLKILAKLKVHHLYMDMSRSDVQKWQHSRAIKNLSWDLELYFGKLSTDPETGKRILKEMETA